MSAQCLYKVEVPVARGFQGETRLPDGRGTCQYDRANLRIVDPVNHLLQLAVAADQFYFRTRYYQCCMCIPGDPVGSKNSNLLSDPDFTTEMLADQRAARPV